MVYLAHYFRFESRASLLKRTVITIRRDSFRKLEI